MVPMTRGQRRGEATRVAWQWTVSKEGELHGPARNSGRKVTCEQETELSAGSSLKDEPEDPLPDLTFKGREFQAGLLLRTH